MKQTVFHFSRFFQNCRSVTFCKVIFSPYVFLKDPLSFRRFKCVKKEWFSYEYDRGKNIIRLNYSTHFFVVFCGLVTFYISMDNFYYIVEQILIKLSSLIDKLSYYNLQLGADYIITHDKQQQKYGVVSLNTCNRRCIKPPIHFHINRTTCLFKNYDTAARRKLRCLCFRTLHLLSRVDAGT